MSAGSARSSRTPAWPISPREVAQDVAKSPEETRLALRGKIEEHYTAPA
ncbi:MAG: hypothetical protein WDO13_05215 [Verrucomicrobiota bacterium]